MPVVHQLPNSAEPDKPYTALTYGPDIRIGAFAQSIVVGYQSYASAAAAVGGGLPVASHSVGLFGPEFRNFVRRNPDLYLSLLAAVDAVAVASGLPAFDGATIVPGELPSWASDPIEDEGPEGGGSA